MKWLDLPTIDRLSTDTRPIYRSSIDRLSTDMSTAMSTEATYSKHDPTIELQTKAQEVLVLTPFLESPLSLGSISSHFVCQVCQTRLSPPILQSRPQTPRPLDGRTDGVYFNNNIQAERSLCPIVFLWAENKKTKTSS